MKLHPLSSSIAAPERMNNPFYYEPHPLCLLAAEDLQRRIRARREWQEEIGKGKMFGVLVVEDTNGQRGYLAAYSGQIAGRSDWKDYVPAVFDYLQPGGYFKAEETEIDRLNHRITVLETSPERRRALQVLQTTREKATTETTAYKHLMAEAKVLRDKQRAAGAGNEAYRIKESQFMKAELRRLKAKYKALIAEKEAGMAAYDREIEEKREERRRRSDALQQWLFSRFIMVNGRGEQKDLLHIFSEAVHRVPPAGSGECCAPKLLQYALTHHLRPCCMAEFWWGASPATELRRHLAFYPACRGKCKPILDFMLQGIEVEVNPLEEPSKQTLEWVFEDEHLMVVCKPAGMLSVPGRSSKESVVGIVQSQYGGNADVLPVHRLDMQTSGLLVIAKSKAAHKHLQEQFRKQEVKKRYVAVLDGEWNGTKEGRIELPLRPDPLDRPRQLVDGKHGKRALTLYKVLETGRGHTRIALYPKTGRTHQLRVHCAHMAGLGIPIVGDELYGRHSDRLYLHAECIEIQHPATGKHLCFERKAPF